MRLASSIAAMALIMASGCATKIGATGERFAGEIDPVPVTWVAPLSTSRDRNVDLTPNPVGLISNVIGILGNIANSTSDKWYINYYEPIINWAGQTNCIVRTIILPPRDEMQLLRKMTLINITRDENYKYDFVIKRDPDGLPARIDASHPCFKFYPKENF